MKSGMWKSTVREIKQSFGRFMAIFAITALGVSLFAGLKVIQPAMVKTTDNYFREKEFYDYRVLSTLGFEKQDLEKISSQEGVRFAEGIVSVDMLCNTESESGKVLKIFSLPENINGIELRQGRLPENSKECVVDALTFPQDCIGQKISLSPENEADALENFAYEEYEIVGTVQSSNYIQFERGNTSLGKGKISGFMYIPMEGFDVDYYTEILVKFDEDYKIYSDEYKNFIDGKETVWESLAEDAAGDRYDRLMDEAEGELADAKQELADGKAEGETELADAKKELDDALKELQDAEKEVADAKQELADGRTELEENRKTLTNAEYELGYARNITLPDAQKEIDENRAKVEAESAKLQEAESQLNAAQAQLNEQSAPLYEFLTLQDQVGQLNSGVEQLARDFLNENLTQEQREALLVELGAYEDALTQIILSLPPGTVTLPGTGEISEEGTTSGIGGSAGEGTREGTGSPGTVISSEAVRIAALQYKLNLISSALQQKSEEEHIPKAIEQVQEAQAEIDANRAKLEEGKAQISSAKAQLEAAQKEVDEGYEELEQGLRKLREGWTEFSKGEAEILKGEAELADAEAELADGWAEYKEGFTEYEDGYQEFMDEIADGEEKIADAEKEIADIEEPESFLLGRDTNVGYVCMENDSAIVNGIANVFPVFFYAVAALICVTTMNRMIEEQRTQIGVLKALGYSEASIMGKYLFYSGSAAISGCLFGYFVGIWLFPNVIWYAYQTMYSITDIVYVFDWKILVFSLVVSMLCSMGATYVTCKNELSEVAAELMRPKAPKAGKRVLLERVPLIWNHLKFLHKVSYRNVFRYKKRFFMMVIGISGCTGLLVTGFGIRDSIANVANDQYGRIQTMDVNVMLNESAGEDTDLLMKALEKDGVESFLYTMEKSIDLVTENGVKSISLVAIDEKDDISPYVLLADANTGETLPYPGEGECILTDKIAKTYGLAVGDTVVLEDENHQRMELRLSGITENYLYNYVYLTTQTYEKCMGEKAERKTVYLNVAEGTDLHQLTAGLLKDESVVSASVSEDAKLRFATMIESLNLVVVVIIICAGFLAFIVLYNLTNINITERIREIATIKVLGFYKNETASYIFRENIILTSIGALAGLLVGKVFHAFVMSQIQVDQVAFAVRVLPLSYLFSILLTLVFAFLVNLVMSRKLDKISMTESLKSVD